MGDPQPTHLEADTSDEFGVFHAFALDGNGGGRPVSWDEAKSWTPDKGVLWLDLNRDDDHVKQWLHESSGIDETICDALLKPETRPRAHSDSRGVLLILRGVNLNPGADPDEMVVVRTWGEQSRVIMLRRFRVMAVRDLADAIRQGRGPTDAGALLEQLAHRLTERMFPVVMNIDELIDKYEEAMAADEVEDRTARAELMEMRRQAVAIRRYLSPQREALSRLQNEPIEWLDPRDRAHLREASDQTMRYVEDLEEARERAAMLREELMARASDRMNRTMYTLSVVAALFLPLSFVTGLLGINVAGIPGTQTGWAFGLVCVLLVVGLVLEVILFRKMKWF